MKEDMTVYGARVSKAEKKAFQDKVAQAGMSASLVTRMFLKKFTKDPLATLEFLLK